MRPSRLLAAAPVLAWLLAPPAGIEAATGGAGTTPGHPSGVGTCREVTCPCTRDQLAQGMEDTPEGCQRKCDPRLFDTYLRKKQTAGDLYEAAADLRAEVVAEAHDYFVEQVIGMGEVSAIKGPPVVVVEKLKHDSLKAMARSRAGLAEKAAYLNTSRAAGTAIATTEIAGAAATALWIYQMGEKTRQLDAEWDESEKMSAEATRLLREATDAFKADLAQTKACARERDKALAAEALADAARQLMERWENNGYLYRDPSGEILDAGAAFERAKTLLSQGGSRGGSLPRPIRRASLLRAAAAGEVWVTREQLERAIAEVDRGIDRFASAMDHLTTRLEAESRIDAGLEALRRRF